MSDCETIVLWRPVGPIELELIKQLQMRAFPPRLPDQPIFYPVASEQYAIKIARDWNVAASGRGFVTRFCVRKDFLDSYEVREVGGRRTANTRRGPDCIQWSDCRGHRGHRSVPLSKPHPSGVSQS